MKLETKTILNVHLSKEEVAQCVQLASIICNSTTSTILDTKAKDYTIGLQQYTEEFKKLFVELNNKNIDRIEPIMSNCEKMNVIIGRDN